FFRYWGNEELGRKQGDLTLREILVGTVSIPLQKELWSVERPKGSSGRSTGESMRFWFMTAAAWAYYVVGLWAAVVASLWNYGHVMHWGASVPFAIALSSLLMLLFTPLIYVALTHIGIGFVAHSEGVRKRVAQVSSWFVPWPWWKLSRAYKKMKDKNEPITGETYGGRFAETVDHYYLMPKLSEDEWVNLRRGKFVMPGDRETRR